MKTGDLFFTNRTGNGAIGKILNYNEEISSVIILAELYALSNKWEPILLRKEEMITLHEDMKRKFIRLMFEKGKA